MEIRDRRGRLLYTVDEAARLQLGHLDLRNAVLADLDLSGVILEHSNLSGADLSGATLYWGYLYETNLQGACHLARLSAYGVPLTPEGANLRGANLRGADLSPNNVGSRTDLLGADLTDADVTEANLTDAEYDDTTRFPASFDPATRHMVKVGRPERMPCWQSSKYP